MEIDDLVKGPEDRDLDVKAESPSWAEEFDQYMTGEYQEGIGNDPLALDPFNRFDYEQVAEDLSALIGEEISASEVEGLMLEPERNYDTNLDEYRVDSRFIDIETGDVIIDGKSIPYMIFTNYMYSSSYNLTALSESDYDARVDVAKNFLGNSFIGITVIVAVIARLIVSSKKKKKEKKTIEDEKRFAMIRKKTEEAERNKKEVERKKKEEKEIEIAEKKRKTIEASIAAANAESLPIMDAYEKVQRTSGSRRLRMYVSRRVPSILKRLDQLEKEMSSGNRGRSKLWEEVRKNASELNINDNTLDAYMDMLEALEYETAPSNDFL